jgi:hypothetical protein
MKRVTIIAGIVAAVVIALVIIGILKRDRARRETRELTEAALKSGSKDDIDKAASTLAENMMDAIPVIADAMKGADGTRKRNAIRLLGAAEPHLVGEMRKEAATMLTSALDDVDALISSEAILALTTNYRDVFNDANEGNKLRRKLRQVAGDTRGGDFLRARAAALEGLGNNAVEGDAEFIQTFLTAQNPVLRMGAVAGMGKIATVNAVKALLQMLPDEKNIIIRTAAVFQVGRLAGLAQGSGVEEEVARGLTGILQTQTMMQLMLQSQEALSEGYKQIFKDSYGIDVDAIRLSDDYGLEKAFLVSIMDALYKWNKGDSYTILFERIRRAPEGSERDVFEGAADYYILSLLNPPGSSKSFHVPVKDTDFGLLKEIGKALIPFIGTASGDFAEENLALITGENHGGDAAAWRELFQRYDSGQQKFIPGAKRRN